ncbi:MAG: EamA family transporter [Streptosporangiaceae bacterium]
MDLATRPVTVPDHSTRTAAIGAIAAMCTVGSLTAISATIGDYPFYGGQAVRYGVAALILLLIARLRRVPLPRLGTRDLALLTGLAATGLAGFNLCLVEGAKHASPATIGTVVGAAPILLALAGPLQQRRRPSPRIVGAAVLVAAGAALANGLGSGSGTGLLWALGALGGEACFALLAVPLLPRLGPILVSAYAAAIAVPMLLAVGLCTDGTVLLRVPTTAEAAAYTYITLVVTVGAFLLWYGSLARLGAERGGLFTGVIPIAAALSTMVLGLGVPSAADFAGAGLVGLGVGIGLRP